MIRRCMSGLWNIGNQETAISLCNGTGSAHTLRFKAIMTAPMGYIGRVRLKAPIAL